MSESSDSAFSFRFTKRCFRFAKEFLVATSRIETVAILKFLQDEARVRPALFSESGQFVFIGDDVMIFLDVSTWNREIIVTDIGLTNREKKRLFRETHVSSLPGLYVKERVSRLEKLRRQRVKAKTGPVVEYSRRRKATS